MEEVYDGRFYFKINVNDKFQREISRTTLKDGSLLVTKGFAVE